MSLPIIPIALGGLALWALNRQAKPLPFVPVKATSGRDWLTRTISVTPEPNKVSTVEVWAPTGAFGPHPQMLVATYRQQGSDMNSRVAVSTGPNVPAAMITAAGQDFGIRKPS